MICSICNCQVISKDAHTIDIKNGVDYHDYVHNHFILCPSCYYNLKYQLEIAGTPIEGPEDLDDIKNDFPELIKRLVKASTNVEQTKDIIEYPGKTVIHHDTEWDRTHPAPGYENA